MFWRRPLGNAFQTAAANVFDQYCCCEALEILTIEGILDYVNRTQSIFFSVFFVFTFLDWYFPVAKQPSMLVN